MATAIKTEAAQDAERLLESTWRFDDAGVPVLPVDPVRIARGLGIQVFEDELPDGVSAALVGQPGTDPVILLSRVDSRNRKRFSSAHELGHFVRRSNSLNADESFEYIDFRGRSASSGDDPDEVYANEFAASLLMPADCVMRLVKGGLDATQMALHFQVSADAMSFRTKNLGLG